MIEVLITGYQWGDTAAFIGEYSFPGNKDQEALHLPPNTTLIPPPAEIPAGQEAAWTGEAWVLRAAPVYETPPILPVEG